jgi:hypothetical protein
MTIPSFVEPGLALVYGFPAIEGSLTVVVDSVTSTTVTETYTLKGAIGSTDLPPPTTVTITPGLTDNITGGFQFWVDPSAPTSSIVGLDGEKYSVAGTTTANVPQLGSVGITELDYKYFVDSGVYERYSDVSYQTSTGLVVAEGWQYYDLPGTEGALELQSVAFVNTPVPTRPVLDDFDGGGTSGALLQSGGNLIDWSLGNGTYSGYSPVGAVGGYGVIGTGDFNGDGTTDILLQDAGGSIIDWTLNKGAYSGYDPVGNANASGYGVVGTGDFNGNGTSDVLLENGSGNLIDWIMKNGTYSGYDPIGNTSGYGVVGTGDFNGDGTSDVLLQNGNGSIIDWMLHNGQYSNYGSIGNASTSGYGLVGTGDFNGDGTTDLLLENGSGNLIDWTIKNGTYNSYNEIGNTSGYSVVGTGDYNGNGTADILLQNVSGNVIDWTMRNGQYSGWNEVGGAGSYAVLNK